MSRTVKTLENLAVESVDKYIQGIAWRLIFLDNTITDFDQYFKSCLKLLKQQFIVAVNRLVYDEVADRVLTAIGKLVNECQDDREEYIISRLAKVLLNSKLKRLSLGKVPRTVRKVILKNMDLMTGLVKLDFGYGQMTITNKLVSQLLKCPTLRELNIFTTVEGYAKLLLEIPFLEVIDYPHMYGFGEVIEHIHKNGGFKKHFNITHLKLYAGHFDEYQVPYVAQMFPMISHIDIDLQDMVLCNVLADFENLHHLTNMRLASFESFFGHGGRRFFESWGSRITCLYLREGRLDSNDVLCIGRCCPDLEHLEFYAIGCVLFFTTDAQERDTAESNTETPIQPFARLKHFQMEFCAGVLFNEVAEIILSNCSDIEVLEIMHNESLVEEGTMGRILASNPMRELKRLRLSAAMTKTIEVLQERNRELMVRHF